jgi:hypothetical protein
MAVANTLAYYDMATIAAAKSFDYLPQELILFLLDLQSKKPTQKLIKIKEKTIDFVCE